MAWYLQFVMVNPYYRAPYWLYVLVKLFRGGLKMPKRKTVRELDAEIERLKRQKQIAELKSEIAKAENKGGKK
jgi:hypothetical protein